MGERRHSRWVWGCLGALLATLVIVLVVGMGMLGVWAVRQRWGTSPSFTSTVRASVSSSPAPTLSGDVEKLALRADEEDQLVEAVYAKVNPGVVNIRVLSRVKAPQITVPELPQIPGFPPLQIPTPQAPKEFYQGGQGSGFVYDAQGHIVTNNHVVAGADEIQVTFADGTEVPATVVGTDPDSDLAVLQVDPQAVELHPLTLGDSDALKVGQRVIAIGNPFGLEGTLTTGVISALGRNLPVNPALAAAGPTYTIPDVIQTDAAINPGNSGGPLLDLHGRVVGVTFQIESPAHASAGIGFAIPVNIVKQVVPVLITQGHYEHPWLGIEGTTLTRELVDAANLPVKHGALVVKVMQGSPAEKAGLRGSDRQVKIHGQSVPVGGDIITAIDDQPVRRMEDLIGYLYRKTQVGQTVTLTIVRDGQTKKVRVTLAARPKQQR